MNKKISVIVAVYNTEEYLDRCLESLLNQTYKNMELVIVEDCSTDSSRKLLKKYKENENIKIFYNKENRGLSYSRNYGLKKSTGDFIGYIDSDDYVEPDYYEKLMRSIKDNKSDIAICDIKLVDEQTNKIQRCKCYTNDFDVCSVINNGFAASACNKLFKRKNIEKYPFAEGKVNEDIAVVIPTVIQAKKISYADTCYFYVQRGGSIQNSKFSDKRFDVFDGVKTTLERIKNEQDYEFYKNAIVYNQLILLLMFAIPKERNFIKRYKFLKKFNELSKDYKITKNTNYLEYLENSKRINQIYYKNLVSLNEKKIILLDNVWISFYKTLRFLKHKKNKKLIPKIDIQSIEKAAKKQKKLTEESIKISVVVPNYNYSNYLYQRVYSILNQNYKIHELIILDDASKDNSLFYIEQIEQKISEFVNVKVVVNDINSGNAFSQWQKGMNLASGDYVWVAEADDYAKENFLNEVVSPLKENNNIVISYADTGFIDSNGYITKNSLVDQIDILKTNHWNASYVNKGIAEINCYSYLNCTIPNVSGTIIKKGNYDEIFEEAKKFHQSGDWFTYLNILNLGDISFINKTLNYYRVHGNNISQTFDKKAHILEIQRIYKFIKEKYGIDEEQQIQMYNRIKFLCKVWSVKLNEKEN
ncbi:uncharacterized protein BN721_01091 [Firmicutes bacterium CAG:582]|nr:uncharacterized protein BN721_01091 [Firmicutes bacterium CAG:582]